MSNLNYDIELNELRVDDEQSERERDNTQNLKESLRKIQEILNDINDRLKALE